MIKINFNSENYKNYKMMYFIMDSEMFILIKKTDLEFRFGSKALNILDSGRMINRMDMED